MLLGVTIQRIYGINEKFALIWFQKSFKKQLKFTNDIIGDKTKE